LACLASSPGGAAPVSAVYREIAVAEDRRDWAGGETSAAESAAGFKK